MVWVCGVPSPLLLLNHLITLVVSVTQLVAPTVALPAELALIPLSIKLLKMFLASKGAYKSDQDFGMSIGVAVSCHLGSQITMTLMDRYFHQTKVVRSTQ